MKLKDGWDKIYEENLDSKTQSRMANSIRHSLESEEQSSISFLAWLLRPMVLAPALGAAALALLIALPTFQRQASVPEANSVRYDPEMVMNAELLYDLRVLRNMELLEKAGRSKWRKKKS